MNVYCAQWKPPYGPIKIGKSGNVPKRMKDLGYSKGGEVELLAECPEMPSLNATELALLVWLELGGSCLTSGSGEWFAPTPQVLGAVNFLTVLGGTASLVEKVVVTQQFWNHSDKWIASQLGISTSHWKRIRKGDSGVGRKFYNGIVKSFPELEGEAISELRGM